MTLVEGINSHLEVINSKSFQKTVDKDIIVEIEKIFDIFFKTLNKGEIIIDKKSNKYSNKLIINRFPKSRTLSIMSTEKIWNSRLIDNFKISVSVNDISKNSVLFIENNQSKKYITENSFKLNNFVKKISKKIYAIQIQKKKKKTLQGRILIHS